MLLTSMMSSGLLPLWRISGFLCVGLLSLLSVKVLDSHPVVYPDRFNGSYPIGCFRTTLERVGIDPSTALRIYELAALVNMQVSYFSPTKQFTYGPIGLSMVFNASVSQMTVMQDCFHARHELCKTWRPCQNGAECLLVELRNGQYDYRCQCSPYYTGVYCETALPFTINDFYDFQREFRHYKFAIHKKLRLLSTGCSMGAVAYKYEQLHSINNDRDEGQLASIIFDKKYPHTLLKLSYSASIRSRTANGFARWFFLIDGKECARPSKIDIFWFQSDDINLLLPALLTGICESTEPGSVSTIPAGRHVIAVNIGPLGHRKTSNAYTGRNSTTKLEVQEICPEF
ncbi:uncharacterized protein LOC135825985 [Sycon ciliatum]|uniref:uncharacterized protein LOC135825985 n=1 Tax=Sycon ciliatum TaxID=27933 RepID=UPI0031F62CBC